MSLKAMVWVMQNSPATLGDRLTLLVLAEHAGDDGEDAYPSQETIARKARLSERQVRRCLANLERDGAIERDGTTRYGTIRWKVVLTPDNMSARTSATETPDRMSPEPSFEPSLVSVEAVLDPSLTAKEPRGVTRARPWKVDRREVRADEEALAIDILDGWNHETGQTLTSKEWLSKIVMRIREHPELAYIDHIHVISRALAEPWWDGHPSPSVVYGNGAQFERCITAARNGHAPPRPKPQAMRYGRGLTTRQILDATQGQR